MPKQVGDSIAALKKKGDKILSRLTGGLIPELPTSVDGAIKMGKDVIKKKGGEMLAKVTGVFCVW